MPIFTGKKILDRSMTLGVSLEFITLLFILTAGLFFRAYGLNEQPFLLDGGGAYSCAAMELQKYGQFFYTGAKTGFVFTIFLGYKLFGVKTLLGLYVDCVFGALTVLMMFILARRLFDVQTALYSSALLGSSFLHILYSRAGAGHAGMMFFLTLSIYFYYLSLKSAGDWRLLSLAGIASGLGLTFHYSLALQLLLVLSYEVYYTWRQRYSPSMAIKRLMAFFLGFCIPVAFFEAVVVYGQLFEDPRKTFLTEFFSCLITNFSPFSAGIRTEIRELACGVPSVYSIDFVKGLYDIFNRNELLGTGQAQGDILYVMKILPSIEGLSITIALFASVVYFLSLSRRGSQAEVFFVLFPVVFLFALWSVKASNGGYVVPRILMIPSVFIYLLLGKSLRDLVFALQDNLKLKYMQHGVLLIIMFMGFLNAREASAITTGYGKAYEYLKDKTAQVVVAGGYTCVWQAYFGRKNVLFVENPGELDGALVSGPRYIVVDHIAPEKLSACRDVLEKGGHKFKSTTFENKLELSLPIFLESFPLATKVNIDYLGKIFVFELND